MRDYSTTVILFDVRPLIGTYSSSSVKLRDAEYFADVLQIIGIHSPLSI